MRFLDYGSGSPIVLVHGLGGSWQSWLENIPELGERHRVVAVDLPGFGGSEVPRPGTPFADTADDFGELLQRLGVNDATIVAHSMGGLTAMYLAAHRPDLIGRVVLANAGGVSLGPARLAAISRGFVAANALLGRPPLLRLIARGALLRRIVMGLFLGNPRSLSPQLAAEIVPLMAAPGLAHAAMTAAREVGKVRPQDVACPVLLIWGAKDRVLPLPLARRMLPELRDGRLAVIEEAGHCPMFEVPDEFNRLVVDFARHVGTDQPRRRIST